MKKFLGLFAFIILTSFIVIENPKALQNGHYLVELDKEYKDLGLNDFDFTLENEKIIIKLGDIYETLEIKWIDEKTFLVKGYTEPLHPTEAEKEILKGTKIYFRITKQEKNEYFFKLGEEFDKYPVFAGKFVKTE